MATTKFTSVDEYIGTFSKDIQSRLQDIRQVIKENAPDAEEMISYNIPAFKLQGMLIFYSAYTHHISISIPPSKVYEAFKKELSVYKVSKSAIQLPNDSPLPLTLIGELTRFRVKENVEMAESKRVKNL
ncbi:MULTISPECIES: iron chaperone [Pedobacter]|uniref:YdhG-like domain-containing protein n=1 Tax=Pedobacter heparinus (strain ATCC 13125 / DSM 2366 / CIP 104194 / JCM 7457 / NBRC 12017 / NCIMB 9290 / NRRL B-14731 / HIM 762-3) TaxID=485917 RepID=C6XX58_PEDHD|nr:MULTISPECIES: DUF1801 domain-containing protein [Pedobacter]ACU06364.1 Domain of unknown function DUF1801 [Pedobacter heparinus DSM 2366]MBB5437296.1 uncharacterized protein YdhG (YjbR/CyaY superfamily) [Pedobacter sp. AK017]